MTAQEEEPVLEDSQALSVPKTKPKAAKKRRKGIKVQKNKISLSERMLRLALRCTRIPAKIFVSRVPFLREDLLRSNLSISAEGLIALSMFIAILCVPIAIVASIVLIDAGLGIAALAMPFVLVLPILVGVGIPKISAGSRGAALENELPYLVGYITTLAEGGISPFVTIERIAKANVIFPASAREARRILLDIKVLGLDPVSALDKAAKYTPNRAFSDFIGGYVAVLKTGGSAQSYLESKLRDIFTYREIKIRATSELMGSLAEAYIISTVVMGVAFTVLFATQNLMSANVTSIDPTQIILFSGVFVPVISVVFIMVINSVQIREPFTYNLPYYVFMGCIPIGLVIFFAPLGLPIYTQLGIGLASISAPGMVVQEIYMRQRKSVESKLANFLRDISEIRKTGLAPEKTIEQLANRNYGGLSKHVAKISAQLSWGTPMRVVLQNFSSSVKSWITKAMTFLLLEVVDVGGGSPKMFIGLADFTERSGQLQKEKKSMVRPYMIIPYIGAIMVVITTAMMVYFINPPGLAQPGISVTIASPQVVAEATNILLTASFFQAWIMGLVAGKMGEDSVADGFKHATLLIVISLITVYVAQAFIKFA